MRTKPKQHQHITYGKPTFDRRADQPMVTPAARPYSPPSDEQKRFAEKRKAVERLHEQRALAAETGEIWD